MPVRSIAKSMTPLKALMAMLSFCANQLHAVEYIIKLKHPVEEYDLQSLMSPTSPVRVTGVVEDLKLIKVDTSKLAKANSPNFALAEFSMRSMSLKTSSSTHSLVPTIRSAAFNGRSIWLRQTMLGKFPGEIERS